MPTQDDAARPLAEALADEFAAVHGTVLANPSEAAYRAAVHELGQSALCLSGGGVRSAAFSLGVLQALAHGRLLGQFDYLSTVSGGGFAGAWLQALIREHEGSAAQAEALLRAEPPPPALSRLRGFTNYLTPQPGMLSADSWADILLYLRNLLINWFGFGPVFALGVLIAIFYRTLLWAVGSVAWGWIPAMVAAGVVLAVGTLGACRDLPSHRPIYENGKTSVDCLPEAQVWSRIVWPLIAWSFIAPLTVAHWLEGDDSHGLGLGIWTLPLVYAAAMIVGYALAAVVTRSARLYLANAVGWIVATFASAGFLWLGLHLSTYLHASENQAEVLAVVGPLWLVGSNVLQSTVHVALRKEAILGDLDREWLARLNALKLRFVVLWALFAFCALSLQRVAFHTPGTAWPFWAVPLMTAASGPVAAWLGKRAGAIASEAASRPLSTREMPGWLLPALALVFAVGLITLLGQVVSEALGLLQRHLPPSPSGAGPGWLAPRQPPRPARLAAVQDMLPAILTRDPGWLLVGQVAVGAMLGLLIWYLMCSIDVNRFSMHGVYRNRLTRAFLGAARDQRRPDPFTGFDPEDNPRMVDLADTVGPRKLFPVVNVTLNLTASGRTAWAERKAASFTITPLACGAAALSCPNQTAAAGCYVRTGGYAGQEHETVQRYERTGMSLASAMTISGAAVSPNWGYHSSPITAFLMTLFNLRLGAWLPNPAVVTDPDVLRLARPRHAFMPLLSDLIGSTTDGSEAIYLSDGGHFDNLGLYEMVRRRCRLIVVVDAGQDFKCDFEDLGAALRKISIDQQIDIVFDPPARVRGRGAVGGDSLDFAMATIHYLQDALTEQDREEQRAKPWKKQTPYPVGRLLYIKPCYLDDLPADVRAYGATHPNFPHESTLDQWFAESQFESYRHLGEHQMGKLVAMAGDTPDLETLFAESRKRAGHVPQPPTPRLVPVPAHASAFQKEPSCPTRSPIC